ncbi:fl(2)d-associated complex component [Ceratina calcarata]|uniref:Fl(2)d-associated complex component n=1 Tax=Ceratina calcarata TaxID=156304 RepID=A0AAJ7ISS3_9HYME|nr:fl(2)d-associated complex component [Ceratina calcarata]XP_017875531.1 fl(2)d-associated complex component [Ceratina calcarata]
MPVVPAAAEGGGQLEDEPPEPRARGGSGRASLMKPLVVLALPGMYLFYKYSQYRQEQRELSRRWVTERELQHLHHKIDKLLTKLEKHEPELASSQEDECVICVNARATVQTAPCGHRVVCRRCFVKTIQMAVSQRLLPLRCVICRAKILRLKQTLIPRDYSMSGKSWVLPQSASEYNMGAGVSVGVTGPGGRWVPGNVPASASLYSMASGSSSISGVSSVSSSSSSSAGSTGSSNLGKPTRVRQPSGATLRRSQRQSMKMRIQEYQDPIQQVTTEEEEVLRENRERRLPPIKEFQRDYRAGKASTRIRCAQKIVTQLESSPSPRGSSAAAPGSTSSSASKAASAKRPQSAPKLSVVQEIQKLKKEKEREKEREKAEKARQKEEEKAEKSRQKEAKKQAKEEKKRAKKEAKARRKEAEEALLREDK